MKKLLSIILVLILTLSVTVTAFASENDGISEETLMQIKETVFNTIISESDKEGMDAEDVIILYLGTASDGKIYFIHSEWNVLPDVNYEKPLGEYNYNYNMGQKVYVYINGEAYELEEAYNNGIIDDNDLEEICQKGFAVTRADSSTQPSSAETEPSTQTVETTAPDTSPQSETKQTATTPEATSAIKSAVNSDNQNGTVQTGQLPTILPVMIMLVLSGSALAFFKKHS